MIRIAIVLELWLWNIPGMKLHLQEGILKVTYAN